MYVSVLIGFRVLKGTYNWSSIEGLMEKIMKNTLVYGRLYWDIVATEGCVSRESVNTLCRVLWGLYSLVSY